MEELTIADIEFALKDSETFHQFRQTLMHKLNIITKTDEAKHQHNLARVADIKNPRTKRKFNLKYGGSYIEDEFEEYR